MAIEINTKEKTVVVSHKTRCMDTKKQLVGEDNPCKTYKTTFDFSDCSEEEILALASKTCTIAFRTKSKVNSITEEEFAALNAEPINVHETMKAESRGLTAEQKITKLASTMNAEEMKELLKKLTERK